MLGDMFYFFILFNLQKTLRDRFSSTQFYKVRRLSLKEVKLVQCQSTDTLLYECQ